MFFATRQSSQITTLWRQFCKNFAFEGKKQKDVRQYSSADKYIDKNFVQNFMIKKLH